ncbi:MAG: glycosyltransferase [Rhodospirillaceae bacterium]|nr:glycosyltransferase [Rhodospirillaceae bacterium]
MTNLAHAAAASGTARTRPYVCTLLIPTKNGGELFRRVVAGLQAQTCWPDVEFLVVDSGSTDDTIAIAKAAGAKVVSIPPADFNHGATRDFGIGMAGTNRIVLTVQDAVPRDTTMIETLLRTLDEDNVAGVYAHQVAQPDADVITKRNLERHYTGRPERVVQALASPEQYQAMHPRERHAVCNFDNVCSALRKDVWEQEKFGRINFGEDIDWAERVLKRGYKIIYEPKAGVIHSHDRPISYEYKRTYVCHRKLYDLFGLELLPTPRTAVRAYFHWTARDVYHILKRERRPWHLIVNILKAPILNYFRILGVYQAERDEKLGIQKTVRGV